jgi:hypothetical protein
MSYSCHLDATWIFSCSNSWPRHGKALSPTPRRDKCIPPSSAVNGKQNCRKSELRPELSVSLRGGRRQEQGQLAWPARTTQKYIWNHYLPLPFHALAAIFTTAWLMMELGVLWAGPHKDWATPKASFAQIWAATPGPSRSKGRCRLVIAYRGRGIM